MYILSPEKGIVPCIHAVFRKVSALSPDQTVVYINNSTPGGLRRAMEESTESWVGNPERLKSFHYERATSLSSLLEILNGHHDLVVIEHLRHIAQEPTDVEYSTQNRLLGEVLVRSQECILIDDWPYLRRYYAFQELDLEEAAK